jgi:hypothetical protein
MYLQKDVLFSLSQISKVHRNKAETQGPRAVPPLLVTDHIRRDAAWITDLLGRFFSTVPASDHDVAQVSCSDSVYVTQW